MKILHAILFATLFAVVIAEPYQRVLLNQQLSNFSIQSNVSDTSILCQNTTFEGSEITAMGNDINVSFYNCSFVNVSFLLMPHTSIFLVSPKNLKLTKLDIANTSNLTVAYYLTINVFHPYGYNTTLFGNLAAGFAYILPLINYTVSLHNDELLMYAFSNKSFNAEFSELKKKVPFGVYGINSTKIYENMTNLTYGEIFGHKRFLLATETFTNNKTINYNPYEIDYSFLGYDQLVMFTLNISQDMNLTPFYIEPIFPKFNFYYIPDNGRENITIKYVIAVPPQDSNWSFTGYLYRYLPKYFTTNPRKGIGLYSSFTHVITFPSPANFTYNGTKFYYINYTTVLPIGLNSSIITTNGTIPGIGRFIEDSTTPSFSLGIAYCSSYTVNPLPPLSGLTISEPGSYHMVKKLFPLYGDAIPQLVNTTCTTGLLIKGHDINIFCDNGTINDTEYGIAILNSSNINIYGCRITGNGIYINNSESINFENTTLSPGSGGEFAVKIVNAQNVNFVNLTIENGFPSLFTSYSSAGTPESLGINIYGLKICNATQLQRIKQFAFVINPQLTCMPSWLRKLSKISGIEWLYLLTALVLLAYGTIFFKSIRRSKRKRH